MDENLDEIVDNHDSDQGPDSQEPEPTENPEEEEYQNIFTGRKAYDMEKRHKLALLVKRLKEADPKSNENRQKLEYNKKKKTWKKVTVTGSYYSQAVRMFYPELKNKLSTDNRFRAAVQFARRSLVRKVWDMDCVLRAIQFIWPQFTNIINPGMVQGLEI